MRTEATYLAAGNMAVGGVLSATKNSSAVGSGAGLETKLGGDQRDTRSLSEERLQDAYR